MLADTVSPEEGVLDGDVLRLDDGTDEFILEGSPEGTFDTGFLVGDIGNCPTGLFGSVVTLGSFEGFSEFSLLGEILGELLSDTIGELEA